MTDVLGLADRLGRYRDLRVRAEVIPDEQHATVWPTAFTHGLIDLYRTDRQA